MSRSAKQTSDHRKKAGTDQQLLDRLLKETFQYFTKRVNRKTGLIADSTKKASFAIIEYIYGGPLFIHQFSHLWIDFRNIDDSFTRKTGFNYFENSSRATRMHREYAIRNPNHVKEYNKCFWGQSASDGPGEQTLTIKGKKRNFFCYKPRGAPYGPDDGTVSPWAVVASLPFAPEAVLETIRYCIENFGRKHFRLFGFEVSFNPTYPDKHDNPQSWISPYRYGLNQAAIILMIENYRTGRIWNIMMGCKYLDDGLKIAGFS